MAKRTVKCQYCEVSDTPKEEMAYDLVGKKETKKYIHHGCFQDYLEDKAFKEKERQEMDILVEVIKDIYNVKVLPNSAYPFLQDLRNGNRFFGKYDYNYKKGYSYALIAETFEYCSETIQTYNEIKDFKGSVVNALRYGLAIVCDKLAYVEKRKAVKEVEGLKIAKRMEKIEKGEQRFESNYKKPDKSKKVNISDFLDE